MLIPKRSSFLAAALFLCIATAGFAQGVITYNPGDVVWSDNPAANLVTPTDPGYVVGAPPFALDPASPLGFSISGGAPSGDSGSAFSFHPSGVTVVPEPGSSALLVISLLGVACQRCYRSRRNLKD